MIYNLAHSILHDVENINVFGLFSFILFFGFFLGVLVWAAALKPKHLDEMGGLPLDGGEKITNDHNSLKKL
jgi:hypothetical protein